MINLENNNVINDINKKVKRAFTLIEVVVGIAILSLLFVSINKLFFIASQSETEHSFVTAVSFMKNTLIQSVKSEDRIVDFVTKADITINLVVTAVNTLATFNTTLFPNTFDDTFFDRIKRNSYYLYEDLNYTMVDYNMTIPYKRFHFLIFLENNLSTPNLQSAFVNNGSCLSFNEQTLFNLSFGAGSTLNKSNYTYFTIDNLDTVLNYVNNKITYLDEKANILQMKNELKYKQFKALTTGQDKIKDYYVTYTTGLVPSPYDTAAALNTSKFLVNSAESGDLIVSDAAKNSLNDRCSKLIAKVAADTDFMQELTIPTTAPNPETNIYFCNKKDIIPTPPITGVTFNKTNNVPLIVGEAQNAKISPPPYSATFIYEFVWKNRFGANGYYLKQIY